MKLGQGEEVQASGGNRAKLAFGNLQEISKQGPKVPVPERADTQELHGATRKRAMVF